MARIALFFSSLRGGGIERAMINLAGGLLRQGLDVDLVVVQKSGELQTQIPRGARLVDLGATRTLRAWKPLSHYLKTERPTTMLAAGTHNNILAIWVRLVSQVPLRLLVSEHNNIIQTSAHGSIRQRLFPLAARWFYRYADGVVAISRGVADALCRVTGLPEEAVRVIYEPSVRPEIGTLAREPLNHPWFATGEPPVILAVGRLAPQKDYPTLLRAFARLHSRRPARLLILGEGEQRQALVHLATQLGIAEQVSMPGFDPNPYRFMARCGVFALSSAWEGFAIVLAEALACGAQVVATDCPSGPAEILENGKYGWLVPVGDDSALAAAMEEALDCPLSPLALQQHARRFDVDVVTRQYLDLMIVKK